MNSRRAFSVSSGNRSGRPRFGLAGWWADLRMALRRARRRPGPLGLMTAIVAVCTAASLTLVALLDSVLVRPLPFPRPEQLVQVWETRESDARVNVAKGNLVDFRRSDAFAGLAGWYLKPRTFGAGEVLDVLEIAHVSADFFSLLGIEPARGRTFSAEEAERALYNSANSFVGADPVVVISHGLWQRLGAPDGVVGMEVSIDRRSWHVLGVMPDGFGFPHRGTDLWIPWSSAGDPPRDQRYLQAIGRLADGVTTDRADADLERIAGDLARRFPRSNAGWGARVEPLHQAMVGHVESYLYMAAYGVGCLALLATLHLLSLQWVHMATRQRELQVRRALGASESGLLRSLFVESQLPVAMGVVAGWPLALLALRGLRRWRPLELPRIDEVALHQDTALWTLAAVAVAGVLCGWLPSQSHGRRAAARSFAGCDLRGAQSLGPSAWWAASEVALTLTVLMVATWVGDAWYRLAAVDTGFDTAGIYVAPVLLDSVGYGTGSDSRRYYRQVLDELRATPGIEAAGASTVPPLSVVGPDFARPIWAQGEPEPVGGHRFADVRIATPGYFATLGVPVVQGRDFAESDDEQARPVVIVNQRLARQHWPDADPVGRELVIDYSTSGTYGYEVVGVVGDVHAQGPRKAPRPELYLPHAQRPYLVMNLVLRTTLAPAELAATVRGVLFRLDPMQPAHSVYALGGRLGESMERERSSAWLATCLGLLALALSGLGVYSLLAVRVAIERPAIGIRCALGADPGHIVRWIVGRGLRVCVAGLAAGAALSMLVVRALSAWMAGILFEVDPLSPSAFWAAAGIGALLVLAATVAASLPPARRGAAVDPVQTLRRA